MGNGGRVCRWRHWCDGQHAPHSSSSTWRTCWVRSRPPVRQAVAGVPRRRRGEPTAHPVRARRWACAHRGRQMTAQVPALRRSRQRHVRPIRTAEWVGGRALRSPDADFSAVRPSEWRNRQTRQLEGLVPARAWGFKSPLRHDCDVADFLGHVNPQRIIRDRPWKLTEGSSSMWRIITPSSSKTRTSRSATKMSTRLPLWARPTLTWWKPER